MSLTSLVCTLYSTRWTCCAVLLVCLTVCCRTANLPMCCHTFMMGPLMKLLQVRNILGKSGTVKPPPNVKSPLPWLAVSGQNWNSYQWKLFMKWFFFFFFLIDMKSNAYRPVETRHRRKSMLLTSGEGSASNVRLSPNRTKCPPPVRPRVKVSS